MPSRIRWSRSPWIISLLSAVFLAGCIRVADLSHTALRYNEAVEQAQNSMLLLNVVRAEQFRPMYITDLTKLSGSIKLDINSGGIETDFGPYVKDLVQGKGALTSGKLTPSVDYVQNPTFDVNVLSSDEFMKGFIKPVPMNLLAYYWEQGWPKEFLLYLFVNDVDDIMVVVDEKGNPKTITVHYENYPDPYDKQLVKLERFGHWVTGFLGSKPRLVEKDGRIGFCLEKAKLDLKNLVTASKEGFSLKPPDKEKVNGDKKGWLEPAVPELILLRSGDADNYKEKMAGRYCDSPVIDSPKPTLNLRSPESILFYLGELMRVEKNFNEFPAVCIGKNLWPLFVAFSRDEEPLCRSAVAVDYEGTEFIIPDRELNFDRETGHIQDSAAPEDPICSNSETRPDGNEEFPKSSVPAQGIQKNRKVIDKKETLSCFGGMSKESFSLLNQLIALHKSAKDTPTTSLVRAIVQ